MGVRDPRTVCRNRRKQVMRLKVRALLKEKKEGGKTAPSQPAKA
ncbi:MAG: hypothetical protein U0800_10315 [Isosphaeraceae bacterium]